MPAAVAPTELMDAAEVQSSVGSFAINVARLGRYGASEWRCDTHCAGHGRARV
jgi:hypothetical protein